MTSRQHRHKGILHVGGEHKHQAHGHPHVDRLDVGHPGQLRHGAGTLRRYGEHGEQTDGDARRDGLVVDPERDPGQTDDQDARDVRLREVKADLTLHHELGVQAGERSYVGTMRASAREGMSMNGNQK